MIYLFQLMNGVGLGMLYFLLAVGLSVIFGLLHFVNFAHGAFYLLGAYLCYALLEYGIDFWARWRFRRSSSPSLLRSSRQGC